MALDINKAKRYEIRTSNKGNKCYYYIFDCIECGVEVVTNKGHSQKHSGKCRSCVQKKRPYISAYTQLLGNQKKSRVDVHLTYEEFYELCLIPNCHYCGIRINRSLKKGEKGYRGYFIDRKDNDKPYIKDNCVPCCWECNQAKGNRYTYEQYKEIVKLVGRPKSFKNITHYIDDRYKFLALNGLYED